jgi:5-methylcytosine-specific restriction endonuclease McrA
MQDDFQALASRLIDNINLPKLKNHRIERDRIEKYYSPPQRYKRWRDSQEGKEWKQQQYEAIKGICPKCQEPFPIKNLEIDHIKPISKFPDLAIDINNLRLLCSACNKRRKSPKTSYSSVID